MKLPKIVFVSISGEGEGQYLQCSALAAEHAEERDKIVRVGKYELVEFADVTLKSVVMPPQPKRKRR